MLYKQWKCAVGTVGGKAFIFLVHKAKHNVMLLDYVPFYRKYLIISLAATLAAGFTRFCRHLCYCCFSSSLHISCSTLKLLSIDALFVCRQYPLHLYNCWQHWHIQ